MKQSVVLKCPLNYCLSDSDSHISGINTSPHNASGASYSGTRLLKRHATDFLVDNVQVECGKLNFDSTCHLGE